MNDLEWIDAQTACSILGVKPQTLYAYVSRGKLRAQSSQTDARQSLYSRHDVELLLQQKKRPRARAEVAQASIRWGDPILKTSISGVKDGAFWLRDHRIETCADTHSLESVADLLCGLQGISVHFAQPSGQGTTVFTRAMNALLQEANNQTPLAKNAVRPSAEDVAHLLGLVTSAVLQAVGTGPIHTWIAGAWGLTASEEDIIRRCLVLLSDHELNPSTFAVRICASTGSSLPVALLAGMATLSGSLHGSAASMALKAMIAAEEDKICDFIAIHSNLEPYSFGFGHPLYLNGDPRAAYLLNRIPPESRAVEAVHRWRLTLGTEPNIDMALSAVARHFGLPQDAPEILFCVARIVGWTAHAMEQVESGSIIRPRALFETSQVRRELS